MSDGYTSTDRYRSVLRERRAEQLAAERDRRAALTLGQAVAEVRDRVHVQPGELVEVFTIPGDPDSIRLVPIAEFAAAWAVGDLARFYTR